MSTFLIYIFTTFSQASQATDELCTFRVYACSAVWIFFFDFQSGSRQVLEIQTLCEASHISPSVWGPGQSWPDGNMEPATVLDGIARLAYQ